MEGVMHVEAPRDVKMEEVAASSHVDVQCIAHMSCIQSVRCADPTCSCPLISRSSAVDTSFMST